MDQSEFAKQVFKDIDGLINVREIDKHGEAKQSFLTLEQLQNYKAPINKNIYYGVYSRKGRKGTSDGCISTGVLWADYDNMAMPQVKSNITAAGLPIPSIFISSGHGIHTYWLLSKRVGTKAKNLLKAIAVNTGADTRATDIARVMRLPGTNNVKGEVIKCEVIENNLNRYNIEVFKDVLNVHDDTKVAIEAVNKIAISELLTADRPCIRAMANGVKEGHRNFIEGRLIKYLQVKGKTKKDTKAIILQWNRNNEPPEDITKLLKDFEMYWKSDYKLLGCSINKAYLQSILHDYCNRPECKLNITVGNLKFDNTVKYNNRLFNYIDVLTGNNLIVLGLLLRHGEGLTIKLLIEKMTSRATRKSCMSRKTIDETLKYLKSIGFVEIVKGNKRLGKENLYKAIPQGTYGLGYTICNNGAINGAIDGRVTSTEFKLYVLLLKYAFIKGNCYPSQHTLAKELRIKQQSVNELIKNLEKADYIKKNISYQNGTESLIYTLLV